jgi:hypothetical protein
MAAGPFGIISLCFPRPNNYRVFVGRSAQGKLKRRYPEQVCCRGGKCRGDSAKRRLRAESSTLARERKNSQSSALHLSLLGFIVLIAFCANLTLIKQVHAANNNSADQIMAEM